MVWAVILKVVVHGCDGTLGRFVVGIVDSISPSQPWVLKMLALFSLGRKLRRPFDCVPGC